MASQTPREELLAEVRRVAELVEPGRPHHRALRALVALVEKPGRRHDMYEAASLERCKSALSILRGEQASEREGEDGKA